MPVIASIASRAVDAARMVTVPGAALSASRGLKLAWADAPDERIDAIWEAARGGYDDVGVAIYSASAPTSARCSIC